MKKCDGGDFLRFEGPVTPAGVPFIRHRPDHSLEVGIASPVKEGQALQPGAMILQRREDGAYDVEDVFDEGGSVAGHGPAMVNTQNYKDGWDRIFGSKKADKSALN